MPKPVEKLFIFIVFSMILLISPLSSAHSYSFEHHEQTLKQHDVKSHSRIIYSEQEYFYTVRHENKAPVALSTKEISTSISLDNIDDSNIKSDESFLENLHLLLDNLQWNHYEDVINVQKVLKELGFYTGTIDGIYGPLTNKAMKKAYQLINQHGKTSIQQEQNLHQSSDPVVTNTIQIEEKREAVQVVDTGQTLLEEKVIQTAKAFLGTPYIWGGTTPNGFDCSGFIQYVYELHQIKIPRTVKEIWNAANPIDAPSIGDLVFFETYQPGPSHVGFYLGNDEFIHAGSSSGVTISSLQQDYWQKRFLGAKRIMHEQRLFLSSHLTNFEKSAILVTSKEDVWNHGLGSFG